MLTYKEALEHSHISLTTMARLIGISKQSLHQKINYEMLNANLFTNNLFKLVKIN